MSLTNCGTQKIRASKVIQAGSFLAYFIPGNMNDKYDAFIIQAWSQELIATIKQHEEIEHRRYVAVINCHVITEVTLTVSIDTEKQNFLVFMPGLAKYWVIWHPYQNADRDDFNQWYWFEI